MYVVPLIYFLCSCHKLEIEFGRRKGMLLENRFCKSCDMNVLGDEFYFVAECSRYSDIYSRTVLPPKYTSVKFMFNLCNLFSRSKNIQLKFATFLRFGKVT